MKLNSSGRVPKKVKQRLLDLEFHLWELSRSLTEMANGDLIYFKNVATILRVLVIEKRSNQPLLISIAREKGIKIPISKYLFPTLCYELQENIAEDKLMPLERYIQKESIGVWFEPDGTTTKRTLKDLILNIAETDGLAHEDESIQFWINDEKNHWDDHNRVAGLLFSAGVKVLLTGLEFIMHLSEKDEIRLERNWLAVDYSKFQRPPEGTFDKRTSPF